MTGRSGTLHNLGVYAHDYGIELSARQLELFELYLNELMRWNEKMNLTGLKNPGRIVIELFLDSLIPAPMIPREGSLLDAGSGAGFPGLPLKILYPGLEVHLLESREKRVSFLRQVIRVMGLTGVHVIQGRIEKDAADFPLDCFRSITARAFAPFPQTLRWCSPLLCVGGMLVCYLGEYAPEILAESGPLIEKERLEVLQVVSYSLPGKRGNRHSVILQKVPQRH